MRRTVAKEGTERPAIRLILTVRYVIRHVAITTSMSATMIDSRVISNTRIHIELEIFVGTTTATTYIYNQ